MVTESKRKKSKKMKAQNQDLMLPEITNLSSSRSRRGLLDKKDLSHES